MRLWPIAMLAAFLSGGAAATAQTGPCDRLAGLKIEDVNLLSATEVAAADGLPAYCRVLGYVRPAVNFEVRMPAGGWNGKFYMAGCGGFCGRLDSDRAGFANAANYGLKRNYAVASTDAGHWGQSVLDGRWAHDNRQAEVDWGHRAVHVTAATAKQLIAAYYGRPQAKSYFAGCSTGGRQANMAASRYPEDFDGIISGAPALDYPGLVGTLFAWLVQANTGPDGKDILSPAEVGLVREAVYAACDAKDGLEDGLISDPRACDFDPAALQCKAGQAAETCLGEAEVATLRKWYAGPTDSAGRQLYPGGIPRGSEPYWWLWLTGDGKGGGRLIPGFNRDFLAFMAFRDDPGEGFTAHDFDFDADPAKLAFMQAIYNSDTPDLDRFRERGGRMIMFHGWADAIVTPFKTVEYYEAVEQRVGNRAATQNFLRLFMVPGMDHCGLLKGPGIDQNGFDPLTALENWVEKGTAPDTLASRQTDKDGRVVWARPLCPWPKTARHDGVGVASLGSSFACADP